MFSRYIVCCHSVHGTKCHWFNGSHQSVSSLSPFYSLLDFSVHLTHSHFHTVTCSSRPIPFLLSLFYLLTTKLLLPDSSHQLALLIRNRCLHSVSISDGWYGFSYASS